MNPEQATTFLKEHYKLPPKSAKEARNMLGRYEKGEIQFPDGVEAEVYAALSVLTCLAMGKEHQADPKRAARSRGKRMRKNRTGSRK